MNMKKIAAIFFGLIIISCNNDDKGELTQLDHFITAKRNNLTWSGTAEIAIDHASDTLIIWGIANRPNDEVVVMKIKFNGTGSYTLTGNQALYYSTVGGDVITSEYRLPPNTFGQLEITQYDETEGLLEGNFEMSLKKVRSNPETSIEVLNFTDGIFKAWIYN